MIPRFALEPRRGETPASPAIPMTGPLEPGMSLGEVVPCVRTHVCVTRVCVHMRA